MWCLFLNMVVVVVVLYGNREVERVVLGGR